MNSPAYCSEVQAVSMAEGDFIGVVLQYGVPWCRAIKLSLCVLQ